MRVGLRFGENVACGGGRKRKRVIKHELLRRQDRQN